MNWAPTSMGEETNSVLTNPNEAAACQMIRKPMMPETPMLQCVQPGIEQGLQRLRPSGQNSKRDRQAHRQDVTDQHLTANADPYILPELCSLHACHTGSHNPQWCRRTVEFPVEETQGRARLPDHDERQCTADGR